MKYTRLSIEYLTEHGFKPFKEEEHLISYSFISSDTYIGFEHHNWDVHSDECYCDWWILMVKCGNLFLKCNCDTVERFKEILKFFEIGKFID